MSASATSAPITTLPVDEPVASQVNRLGALTGVRIFAALAVYLHHIGPPHGAPEWLRTLVSSGYMGVTVFFVLSGFVLALNYVDSLTDPTPGKVWRYAVARFARVYPLYLLVMIYAIVDIKTQGGALGDWWKPVLAVQAWDPNGWLLINPPAWSISVEVFLYACLPVLVIALARVRSTRALLITGGVVMLAMAALALYFVVDGRDALAFADPGSSHRWLYRTPATRIGDFLLGIIAARLYLNLRGGRRADRIGRVLAPAAGVALVVLMALPSLHATAWSWDVAYAVPAVVLFLGLALAPRGLLSRLLARPTIVLLGEASYAFYLVHFLLIWRFDADRWGAQVTPMILVFELLTLGIILAISVGLHIMVEKPARAWIRKLARGRVPRAARDRPLYSPGA